MRALAILLLASLLVACASKEKTVSLAGDWPAQAGDYRAVTRAWTRHGQLYAGFDEHKTQLLEVYATFKSPAWRAAYADFRAKRQMLPEPERADLLQKERAEAGELYEVHLSVSTFDRRANDLQKGERSAWRVALVNDRGDEVEASEIERDRRPPSVIRAEFPHFDSFQTPYIARFPKSIEIFGPDAESFSLKVANQRGGVELIWRAR